MTLSALEFDYKISKYDLALFMREIEGSLTGRLWYQTELFDATSTERMVAHYLVLLGSIVAHPDAPISQLEILTEAERDTRIATSRLVQSCRQTGCAAPGGAAWLFPASLKLEFLLRAFGIINLRMGCCEFPRRGSSG